jgi:hypothetical protein
MAEGGQAPGCLFLTPSFLTCTRPILNPETRNKDMNQPIRMDFLVFVKDQEFKELRREEGKKKSWQV